MSLVRWPKVTSCQTITSSLPTSGVRQLCYEGNVPRSWAPPTQSCSHRPRQLGKYLSSRLGLSKSTITTFCLLFTLGKKTTDCFSVTDKRGSNMLVSHNRVKKRSLLLVRFYWELDSTIRRTLKVPQPLLHAAYDLMDLKYSITSLLNRLCFYLGALERGERVSSTSVTRRTEVQIDRCTSGLPFLPCDTSEIAPLYRAGGVLPVPSAHSYPQGLGEITGSETYGNFSQTALLLHCRSALSNDMLYHKGYVPYLS